MCHLISETLRLAISIGNKSRRLICIGRKSGLLIPSEGIIMTYKLDFIKFLDFLFISCPP